MKILVEINSVTNILMFYLVKSGSNRKLVWLGHCILGLDGSWVLTMVATRKDK